MPDASDEDVSDVPDVDYDETMSAGLLRLSAAGGQALLAALLSLPDDHAAPVPLCERIAQLLDVVVPLTTRADISAADRAILLSFCRSDRRLVNFAELTLALDGVVLRSIRSHRAPI